MNNSTNEKKAYEAPALTVVTFKTERGYAASGDLTKALGLYSLTTYGTGDQNLEDRGATTDWSW